MSSSLAGKRICVTGGAGFLGRSVCAKLRAESDGEIFIPRSSEYDLTQAGDVERMFDAACPEVVIHLAAEVGGIGINRKRPGRFCYANLSMGLHLIEESRRRSVEKFVQVGSVCAYPKFCDVPFREEDIWNGYPEETNAPYGVAKRALGVLIESYRAEYGFNGIYLIPVNLYGPGDNFDAETSHVIPALIRQFCHAASNGYKSVQCWGSGNASREFLYVDDAAEALVRATAIHNDSRPINLGTCREIKIADLAALLAELCEYTGEITWDATMPDGQPRRCLDTTRAATLLDWQPRVDLEEGLQRTVSWWRSQRKQPIKEVCTAP
ncbi:MAG: GDP-L-fucose synthase [Phycisphaerales bacterium]|nr:MAG: GDP-L-fucose synthase [Phycisphaerales bacterium]